MQSKDISTMSSYLMMLYVTLEQESALKNFFLGQGWTFCKPDLSVTTDKLGPSTLKQIGQNQLEPYLETPVAPIYNKKRKPKSSKSKETPPLKQQKSAQKQQSNDELEEVGNVVEGEAVGSEAKETRLGQSSGAENRPGSSRSVVLEDGREVTVKIEADFSESDNNEDGESELKDNDDDVNDNLDDDNDETDVDYNFLEEGEIRLKNEDMSLPAGSQSGESSLLDHLHGDSIEDQSMLEDSLNNETKVEDGAKIKGSRSKMKYLKPFSDKRYAVIAELVRKDCYPSERPFSRKSFCKDDTALIHYYRLRKHLSILNRNGEDVLYYFGKEIMKRSNLKDQVLELYRQCPSGARVIYKKLKEQYCAVSERDVLKILKC